MITFRKVTEEEFGIYEDFFIADYSKEISENYGYSLKDSIAQAKRELDEGFPGGVALSGNYLVSIELTEINKVESIGYLWYSLKKKSDYAFICDFYIRESYRGKGYGRAAFEVLEGLLVESGTHQVRLRVAFTNARALKLYKEIGFEATGINMVKRLKV